MTNIFKAYYVAPDSEFVRYINNNKNKYNDGQDITP